jgi:hypothetical protein
VNYSELVARTTTVRSFTTAVILIALTAAILLREWRAIVLPRWLGPSGRPMQAAPKATGYRAKAATSQVNFPMACWTRCYDERPKSALVLGAWLADCAASAQFPPEGMLTS